MYAHRLRLCFKFANTHLPTFKVFVCFEGHFADASITLWPCPQLFARDHPWSFLGKGNRFLGYVLPSLYDNHILCTGWHIQTFLDEDYGVPTARYSGVTFESTFIGTHEGAARKTFRPHSRRENEILQ